MEEKVQGLFDDLSKILDFIHDGAKENYNELLNEKDAHSNSNDQISVWKNKFEKQQEEVKRHLDILCEKIREEEDIKEKNLLKKENLDEKENDIKIREESLAQREKKLADSDERNHELGEKLERMKNDYRAMDIENGKKENEIKRLQGELEKFQRQKELSENNIDEEVVLKSSYDELNKNYKYNKARKEAYERYFIFKRINCDEIWEQFKTVHGKK